MKSRATLHRDEKPADWWPPTPDYATHIIQNIGMVMGLLPITGLPLPFFSYGGSYMLTCLAAIGLTLGIGARRGL